MRIAILSSEAVPFSKSGGLGDVAGALPGALARHDEDVALVTPLYETIDRNLITSLAFDDLMIDWLGAPRRLSVYYSDKAGAPTFLIDAPEYFRRPGLYGYADDHERFAFFCHAALALLQRTGAPPDVLHGNDWFCGFSTLR